MTPEERERDVPKAVLTAEQMADAILGLVLDDTLDGRVAVWLNGEDLLLLDPCGAMVRRWGIVLAALFVAGIVLAAVGGTTLDAVGLGLAGMAVVGAVSLGFLAVGRGEDRARAEEAERRADPPSPQDGRVDQTRMKRRRDH